MTKKHFYLSPLLLLFLLLTPPQLLLGLELAACLALAGQVLRVAEGHEEAAVPAERHAVPRLGLRHGAAHPQPRARQLGAPRPGVGAVAALRPRPVARPPLGLGDGEVLVTLIEGAVPAEVGLALPLPGLLGPGQHSGVVPYLEAVHLRAGVEVLLAGVLLQTRHRVAARS